MGMTYVDTFSDGVKNGFALPKFGLNIYGVVLIISQKFIYKIDNFFNV